MRLSVRALGLLALLTFLIYARSLPSAFVFDDHWTVLRNVSLRSAFNPVRFFLDPNTAANPSMEMGKDIYRPLSTLTLWINHRLSGTDPSPYRLTNLLLHLLNGFLIFQLMKNRLRLPAGAALIGAAVFLSHPAQVESVVWITQRSNLLCMAGILSGLLCLTPAGGGRSRWKTSAGMLWAVAAMASKETAVVFPALLVLMDSIARPDLSFKEIIIARWRLYAALFLLTLLFIGWRHAVVGSLAQRDWRTGHFTGNILFGARAWVDYLKIVAWPDGLTVSHAQPAGNPWKSPLAWTGLFSWAALGSAAVALWRRGQRIPATGMIWFFVGLAPVLGFVPLVTYMAERFLYVPVFGVALIAAWGWEKWFSFSKITSVGAGVFLVAALSSASFLRTKDWRDDLTLWKSATNVDPANAFAWACLGEAESLDGKWDDARRSYESVFAHQPDVAVAFTAANNMAGIANRQNRAEESLSWCDKAATLRPGAAETFYNRVVALALLRRTDEALAALDHAEKSHPDNPAWPLLREKIKQRAPRPIP